MSDDPNLIASPLYAIGRLEQALAVATSHADPQVRKRAAAKGDRWRAVLAGIADTTLAVGSRTPVADTPAWVTLEVAHGGFATGRYMAEGPLEVPEEELAARVDDVGTTPRGRVNAWYLSDEGQAALVAAIREGRLAIELPEDGALPVVAWLLVAGYPVEGLDLVGMLQPLMHRLRFYPRLTATPRLSGSVVRVQTIAQAVEGLQSKQQPHVVAMSEALQVWNPLYDRLVLLWLETVDSEVPWVVVEAGGRTFAGGWPGRVWPAEWTARRDVWLADYQAAAAKHMHCRKHLDPDSNFFRLRVVLEKCPGGRPMTVGDENRVRHALARTITRRGAPGSAERTRLRVEQAGVAARPTNIELAQALIKRVRRFPADGGLPSLEAVSGPIAEGEHLSVRAGTKIPPHMIFKASRALEAPIAELVERRIIGSAEVLAVVLPQITAQVAAEGIADLGLRDLYSQIYAAFRRRRSLLLLNLESQVRFEELPWIAALAPLRRDGLDTQAQARQTLEEAALLAFTGFPETILPNLLVRELAALSQRAGLKIPFVEEVAADIFMGMFTVKWDEAAAITVKLLAGTLYARYYDLPTDAAPAVKPGLLGKLLWGKPTTDGFTKLCEARAREAGTMGGSPVARNGAILEQSQILTSHNLAALVDGLGLSERMRVLAPTLAGRAFIYVVRRQAQSPPDFKSRLQAVKNAAYAWRQAIFFLSFCEPDAQWRLVDALAAEVAAADREWAERFAPAVAGLRGILVGGCFDADGRGPEPELALRFLGWSVGKHWVFA